MVLANFEILGDKDREASENMIDFLEIAVTELTSYPPSFETLLVSW